MTARPRGLTDRSHPDRLHLGQQIRARRERLGMTQRDLAAVAAIGQCSISYVENATRDVMTSTVVDLAAALDRRLAVVAEHHLPLLDLTAAEVAAITANTASCLELGDDPHLVSALTKLTAHDIEPRPLVAPYRPAGALDATTVHLPA